MIEALKTWLFGLISAAMILSCLYAMLPKNTVRGIAKVTGGLIMLLVLMRPVLGMDWEDLTLQYRDYQQEIDRQIEIYEEENQQQMNAIIEEELSAYVWEKAAQLGLDCTAAVKTQLRDGVPYPVSVTLSIKYNEDLSRLITEELGIAPEQQFWEGNR